MHPFIDYTGCVFKNTMIRSQGNTKITTNPDGSIRKTTMWNCVCNCGRKIIRSAKEVKRDRLCMACGNKKRTKTEIVKKITTHPIRNRLKTIWTGMKNRCYNKNHVSFKYYGAKGISICQEWIDDFDVFKTWALENGYEETLTLDRNNGTLNYNPTNCRWITRTQQQNNRSNNRFFNFNGQLLTASAIAQITGKSYAAEYLKNRKLNHNSIS